MGRLVVTGFETLDDVIGEPRGVEKVERGGWSFGYDRDSVVRRVAPPALHWLERTLEGEG